MPSKDLNKAIRTPSFRSKMSAMKGLSPPEKALFQRIGNLVDVLSYSQRQVANPGRGRSRKLDGKVPTPQNVDVNAVSGGIEVSWDPVDMSELEFYEVQFGETATFASFEKIEAVSTRVIIKKQVSGGVLFVRIRTVSKRGLCSEWTATTSATTEQTFFTSDQDAIDPENRTTVLPKPELLGSELDNSVGNNSTFVGVGGNIGPSPIALDDTGQLGFFYNVNIRHDISYVMHENADPFPGIELLRAEPLGQEFNEASNERFYDYDPGFYIYPHVLSGSFTDFFTVNTVSFDPSQLDVELLRYQEEIFYGSPNFFRQSGFVYNAVMSNLKF